MPIILLACLGLGAVASIQGPADIAADTATLLVVIGFHVALIGFVVFASIMGKRQESGTFLGLSPTMWPVAAAVSYIVGLAGPYVLM